MQTKQTYNWKHLVIEQQQSGLNMKAFCRQYDLPYHSFKSHKYTLQKEKKSVQVVPVTITQPKKICFSINNTAFVIDSSIDDESLQRMLKALSA